VISRSTASRIEAINQASREIMGGDLSRRVATRGSGDDFDQLADNLNSMLDRILSLMQAIRQVSDDIAHDLRTPLTRLRSRLELARSAVSDAEEARVGIEQAIAEADALLATFNALLRIARIEAGQQRFGFSKLDLVPLVGDVVELYEPLASDKGQELASELPQEAVIAFGDRDLLFQGIANLLDNAIKYTPAGGRVGVHLRKSGEGAEVVVWDSGPGIPAALRAKVFERFFRLEQSRSAPGSGLGLSLVGAVVKLHAAQIRLEDGEPGLRVVLSFPPAGQAAGRSAAPTQPMERRARTEI
jgi:signal transduction histidine kinase